jgi:hypothetical protein
MSAFVSAFGSPDVVNELKASKRPSNMTPEEQVVYDFVTELTTARAVSDETFKCRALGYGLKYATAFGDTHLSHSGRS